MSRPARLLGLTLVVTLLAGFLSSPANGRLAVAQAPAAAPVNPAASAAGKLSRRSFEVIGGVNGLFRTVEANGATLRPAGEATDRIRPVVGRVATP